MILITFILKINASFVFMEMSELRFCGLDKNLKNSIVERADTETKILLKDITAPVNDEESINKE